MHFIDTPGAPDFLGQSLPALEAVETAAVVINASTGVEPMAVRMMEQAAARQRDRLIIVNKIDVPGVDLPGVLAQIQAAFGKECLPVNLPDAGGTRVVDCFYNREGHSDFGSVDAAHRALVEQVVEVDADFVERYLNEGDVDASRAARAAGAGAARGPPDPGLLRLGAKTGAGVAELLDIIVKLLPNPAEANPPDVPARRGRRGGADRRPCPTRRKHVLAHVFKVTVDPFVGRLGVFRVHQGTVTKDSLLYIGDGRKPFKVGRLFMLQGKDHVEVAQALPGDIAAVAKVDEIRFDAVLHDAAEDDHIHLAPLPFPKPVHGLAIEPKRHGDEQRMWEILTKLVDEDPCLKLEHLAGTNETVVFGLGELHLRVLLERLRETYRFEVDDAAAAGRLSRDDHRAGRGPPPAQEAERRRRPVRRGVPARRAAAARQPASSSSTRSRAARFPASSSRRWRRACARCSRSGAIAGYPVVDVRVVVYDGKHHSVDSKEIAFVTAGRKAFLAAVRDGAADRARADRQRRDHGAAAGARRHHRRPGVAPRHGERHGQRRARDDDGARPGADVGAARLPEPAQRADQRPGPLHGRVLALRGGAGEHAAAAGRRVQGARRRSKAVALRGRAR